MELDLLSMVAGAVAAKTGGDVTGAATAPVRAVGEHWKQQVLARLQRHQEKIDKRGAGPVEAPDSVRVKAGVEAALRDDDLAHEYLAGVVAGASDDSPTSIVSMIGRLSSLDLRLHCLLYGTVHRLVSESGAFVEDIRDDYAVGQQLETYFDLDLLTQSLGIGDGPDASRRLLAALRALASENLIAPYGARQWVWGNPAPAPGFVVGSAAQLEGWLSRERIFPGAGVVVRPSVTGMSLMAWVFSKDGTGDPASYIGLGHIPVLHAELQSIDAALVRDLQER